VMWQAIVAEPSVSGLATFFGTTLFSFTGRRRCTHTRNVHNVCNV
jgi:hypothetical protein